MRQKGRAVSGFVRGVPQRGVKQRASLHGGQIRRYCLAERRGNSAGVHVGNRGRGKKSAFSISGGANGKSAPECV